MSLLEIHKAKCKFQYKNILNYELCAKTGFSENTLIKYRKSLVEKKYFQKKPTRVGKSVVLQYRFDWKKLLKLKLIIPIEQSEYKPKFINKDKQVLKKGHSLTIEDIPKLKADTIYHVKRYRLDNQGNRKGNGAVIKPYGKDLKSIIIINHRTKEVEYIIGN